MSFNFRWVHILLYVWNLWDCKLEWCESTLLAQPQNLSVAATKQVIFYAKNYSKETAQHFIFVHKEKKIYRIRAEKAWNRASGYTVRNGVSGFYATNIFPFNSSAAPNQFFNIPNAANRFERAEQYD